MIQLRYGTGNPTSAIFGFKINSSDGEEFSFKLDHEVGSVKTPSHFMWLSKQVAKSSSSSNYLLHKCSKDSTYQKEYSSLYKASKRFNISRCTSYKRKSYSNYATIYKEFFLNLYNERINRVNVFNSFFTSENYNALGVQCDHVKLTRPNLDLAVKNEYVKLFRTDRLGNLGYHDLNLSRPIGDIRKYKSNKDLSRSNSKICENDIGYLVYKYDYSISKLDINKPIFKEGPRVNITRESIASLSKASIEADIVRAYLEMSQNNYNLNYEDNLLVDNNSPESNILKEYIDLSTNSDKLKIDNSKTINAFHKELSKYNAYKFFSKEYSILNKFVATIGLFSNNFNMSLNNIYLLKNRGRYIDKQYETSRLHKKADAIAKYDFDIDIKNTPINPNFYNNTVFAYSNELRADTFSPEKSLDIAGEDVIIENTLKSLYRSESKLKIHNSYDWLNHGSKDLSIKFSNIGFESSHKSLFKEEYLINLVMDGKEVSVRPTDIIFNVSGKKALICDMILNFSTESVDVRYNDKISRWLDSSKQTLGIFSSEWVSNSSDNLSIENYLIMGYNHNKKLDKYNFTFLGFEKDSFDFLIPDEISVAMSERSIVNTDNIFGHVRDFVPPIKILEKASDELLLPREGFDYSTYKNEVFSTNLTVNPKYIKGITEEGNPIINVPIENPVKYYTDIAKEYIDVDVVIMRKVLELLYRNWRRNIHRYAGLEPAKAINNILELTHKDLLEFYTSVTDKNRIKHAERSLKLFAWYCEMGMLSHSDKEVVYKRSNGVFDFWDKLPHYGIDDKVTYKGILKDEITEFKNFVCNSENKFILSSLPGQNASMTISDMPQVVDTNLNFKAYILGKGVLRVSVDDRVYTYSERINIIDVLLPSDGNKIEIKFFPSNEVSSLDIAEFVIKNRYNDSYELVYTGKVKNMNYTLQYVLDFMSIAGDSIEEVQPVLKSTAQLAYALDKFKEYMETHHDNKFKGKRLTIRK